MQITNNLSFKGAVNIYTYSQKGKRTIQTFQTDKYQDKWVKAVANSMAKNGIIFEELSKDNATTFSKLIETITGKKLKKTTQPKIMINSYDNYVTYGDRLPENGGVFVDYYFNARDAKAAREEIGRL